MVYLGVPLRVVFREASRISSYFVSRFRSDSCTLSWCHAFKCLMRFNKIIVDSLAFRDPRLHLISSLFGLNSLGECHWAFRFCCWLSDACLFPLRLYAKVHLSAWRPFSFRRCGFCRHWWIFALATYSLRSWSILQRCEAALVSLHVHSFEASKNLVFLSMTLQRNALYLSGMSLRKILRTVNDQLTWISTRLRDTAGFKDTLRRFQSMSIH